MPSTTQTFDYRPRLALQIGVTGHRELNVDAAGEAALLANISAVLQQLNIAYQALAQTAEAQAQYSPLAPLPPRLLSPLASGADSLAARAALANQFELHCPLPFPRAVYEADFNVDSLPVFTELWGKAERRLELDGVRTEEHKAYLAVGRFVLRHADILLAVWDEQDHKKTIEMSPGTEGVVAEALQVGLPVILINPGKPELIKCYDPRQEDSAWQVCDDSQMASLLRWRLLQPNTLAIEPRRWERCLGVEKHFCRAYFNHKAPKRTLMGTVYRTLFAWFGKHDFWPSSMIGQRYRADAECQWQTLAQSAQDKLALSPTTQQHFVRADSLASYYADRYRGTFVTTFTLGALAVLLALLGAPFEGFHGLEGLFSVFPEGLAQVFAIVFAWAELGIIVIIALLVWNGRVYNLHQRWVDFRLLAERLRHYAYLTPIGGVSHTAQSVFDGDDDQTFVLVDWLARALSRAEGIPKISFDADYRLAYRDFLLAAITDQADYHDRNHARNHRIAHTLHRLNLGLLIIIVAACLAHIYVHHWAVYTTFIAAVLPAVGAAVAGVLSQGEFERVAKRSKGMNKHLLLIFKKLDKNSGATVLELAEQAQRAIDTMSQELYDWRVIFRGKPLEQHA
ncbi:MAG: hypothetical protein HOP34_15825 [Methylococcaceae bacterium]|nr:hypothetical protein [Methylococcaceae bacterium]